MKKKKPDFQTLVRGAALLVMILILLYIFKEHSPRLFQLVKDGKISQIDDYVRAQGSSGAMVMILLQSACTVTIVLPLFPIYICDGIIFGKITGIIMCYVTNVAMNLVIFKVAGFSKKLTDQVLGSHSNPWLQDLLDHTHHPDRVFLIASAIPLIPNGLIPFVASRTNIRARDFIRAIAIGCLPSTIIFIVAGDAILHAMNSPGFVVFIVSLIVAGAILFFKYRKRITEAIQPRMKEYLSKKENESAEHGRISEEPGGEEK